ncbi:methyltransferase domain-containing protein [Planctomycetota bacterium]
MPICRICNDTYSPFMSFGQMPIANGFLDAADFAEEYFFDMQMGHCSTCNMVQLVNQPERERMFHENYAFFSSTSKAMATHFADYAALIMQEHLKCEDPFVVEIGSNDGIMLQNFKNVGIRHLGIEPSANVAQAAIAKGIHTISEFFDETLARQIVAKHGQADAIVAANVMCHIPYLHSVVAGYQALLKPNGILMFEDPYLGDVIENTSYDQIYDEHVFLFSVVSVNYLFNQHGMEVVDVLPQATHGGSMRYVLSHQGTREISKAAQDQIAKENSLGLHLRETYDIFRSNVERSRTDLVNILTDLRKQGKRIVGYAATSKSTTINNYCGITTDLVEYICDTTPIKQGKFSPGTHIPVRPYQDFCESYPDYALLYAYNHAEEILAKEQPFIDAGGKWILYVPKVTVQP